MENEVHINGLTGSPRIVSIKTPVSQEILEFIAIMGQAGVGIPTFGSIIKNDFGFVPVGIYSGVGDFEFNQVAGFPVGDTVVYCSGGDNEGDQIKCNVINDPDRIIVKSGSQDGAGINQPANDVINNACITIQKKGAVLPTTPETTFNYVLTQLDANQLLYWTKIIVRDSGNVYSIDGDLYRKTGVYATSVKQIKV